MKTPLENSKVQLRVVEAPSIEPIAELHPLFATYLNEIKKGLAGYIKPEAIQFYLNERACWIEHRFNSALTYGATLDEAATQALQLSPSVSVAVIEIIEEDFDDNVDSPILNRVGRANGIAGTIFGMGNAIYLVLLQIAITTPSDTAVVLAVSPMEIRKYFPKPLPFPELSWQFGFTVGYPVIAPFILGWICGMMIPVRAVQATFLAILIITLTAFLMGVALLPNQSALIYAVWQTIFWLPVGCLTAHLSSSFARYTRRRKFGSPGYSRAPK